MLITVENLAKHYQVYRHKGGILASLGSLFIREYDTVKAVDDISFHIGEGEIVGFLGANGAGKTTTLKCLAGLLYPTAGKLSVLGFTPHQRTSAYLRQITLIMGQRNQLMWDLPAQETFRVNHL
jgi:ABC-2 type transport system ATP-binding protein